MEQIPDAPWIRDAELNGYGDYEPIECPICGEECETIYRDRYGEVVGCDECITTQEAYEWAEEQKEADRDDT